MSRKAQSLMAVPFIPYAGWWGTWLGLTLAARSPRKLRPSTTLIPRGMRVDVVIPAHNESQTITELIDSLRRQTSPHLLGTILVVADHCTDNTAETARRCGAEVLIRSNGDNGKPLALRDGFAALSDRSDRGNAVVVVDGDCVCEPEFLERIAYCLVEGADAVQAAYTVADVEQTPVRAVLSSSFALRNVIRASGANRVGVPVGLFGSGMAFRYEVTKHFSFTDVRSSSSTDRRPAGCDVTMWLDLLEAGIKPVFADGAGVIARTPDDEPTLKAQRLRWERAQSNTRSRGLALFASSLQRGQVGNIAALADWSAPPLVQSIKRFGALLGALSVAAAIFRLPRSVFRLPTIAVSCLASYVVIGSVKLHGVVAAVRNIASIPAFIFWKLRIHKRETTVDVREGARSMNGSNQ